MIKQTKHFTKRMAQRGLKSEIYRFIYNYGVIKERAGGLFIVIERKRLPKEFRNRPIVEKAVKWTLFLSDDNQLITCYARDKAKKYIEKKTKRDYKKHRNNFDTYCYT